MHTDASPSSGPRCLHCDADSRSVASPGFPVLHEGQPAWSCEACTAAHAPTCDACGEPIWPGPQAESSVAVRREAVAETLWFVHGGCAPTHLLRCAWEVWREFGGPEEGGWHFDAGVLLAAVPVPLLPAEGELVLLNAALQPVDGLLERAFPFGSSASRLRLSFEVALPAPSFPETRPRYE